MIRKEDWKIIFQKFCVAGYLKCLALKFKIFGGSQITVGPRLESRGSCSL